ncbi:diguanylate cyclase domain-containing protein [Actinocrispum wychmicini]|uniref:GGDEF domain-containing protein n=1 Tax=Actinocrispum wychmicini TaxID=1213861 RepID=A0A4R2J303_9PSEU|nr:diguanylate cyclase [Actinocrispum wychmicini]TCO50709.1 GGDEF domain-containing protein [Actinocrispum wychmicini]
MAAGRKGSRSGGGESDGELLVDTADRLRWRAPELALEFARQAATRADSRDGSLRLRASALVVAALVRLGKHAEAVQPAVLALREAESAGAREVVGPIRVDLAASTRTVGLAGSALVLVRPLLEGGDARPAVRAGALAEIVGGLAQAGRRAVVDEVLSEADRLYAADDSLSGDVRRVLRALLCARVASFRRRWGNATGAVASATEGMALLDGLADPGAESGQARAELGLEMVTALLDAGEVGAALGQADQTLDQPVRAPTAAPIGRLMFVLATRVHIPDGRVDEAHALFAEIVRIARRHGQDALLADVLTSLAHEQEAAGDLTGALESLRSARAADHRRLREDTMARLIVLEELGAGTRLPDDTESLLRRVVRSPARAMTDPVEAPGMAVGEPRWPDGDDRDAETGLLNRQGLRRRLAAARRQSRPTALTLVRLEPTSDAEPEPQPNNDDPDSTDRFSASLIDSLDKAGRRASPEVDADVLSSLVDHVRDMAPEQAELVRPEEDELAVLLPDTTRDEAEEFAASLRATMSTSDWDPADPAWGMHLSTGVAQYQEGTSEDALLSAAREALTGQEYDGTQQDTDMERPAWQSVEPVFDVPTGEDNEASFADVQSRTDGYTYIEEYASTTDDHQQDRDPELEAYLAGFSLPEYGQWSSTQEPQEPVATPDPEPFPADPPARHDAAKGSDQGRSVLDRLGITPSGGGGRRRAPDSLDTTRPPQDQPPTTPSHQQTGRRRRAKPDPDDDHPAADNPASGHPASSYPASGHPASSYPASGHPASNYSTADHPAFKHPTSNYTASSHSTSDHPASNYTASNYTASNYTASNHPASDHPISDHPASDYSASSYSASDHPGSDYSDHLNPPDQPGRPDHPRGFDSLDRPDYLGSSDRPDRSDHPDRSGSLDRHSDNFDNFDNPDHAGHPETRTAFTLSDLARGADTLPEPGGRRRAPDPPDLDLSDAGGSRVPELGGHGAALDPFHLDPPATHSSPLPEPSQPKQPGRNPTDRTTPADLLGAAESPDHSEVGRALDQALFSDDSHLPTRTDPNRSAALEARTLFDFTTFDLSHPDRPPTGRRRAPEQDPSDPTSAPNALGQSGADQDQARPNRSSSRQATDNQAGPDQVSGQGTAENPPAWDWAGLRRPADDEAGPDRAAGQRVTRDQAGPDRTGGQQVTRDQAGSDRAGGRRAAEERPSSNRLDGRRAAEGQGGNRIALDLSHLDRDQAVSETDRYQPDAEPLASRSDVEPQASRSRLDADSPVSRSRSDAESLASQPDAEPLVSRSSTDAGLLASRSRSDVEPPVSRSRSDAGPSGSRSGFDLSAERRPLDSRRPSAMYLSGPATGIGEEVLAAAARASVPQFPEPDDVPRVPDPPDVPPVPEPDDVPRVPDPPDVPGSPDPDVGPGPHRRPVPARPNPDVEPVGARSARRRSVRQRAESVPSEGDEDRSAWRRRLAARREADRESVGRGGAVPPEQADPVDPLGPDESPESADRPSRLRRKDNTAVGLGDLLAEALAAYQSSHSDTSGEDVPSSYDDLPDSGRHHPPTTTP